MAEREAERDDALLTRVRAMEQAIGEIGTTLDATSTCRELASFAARHLHASTTVHLRTEPGTPPRPAAHVPRASAPRASASVTHRLSLPLAVHDEEPLGSVTLARVGGAPFSGDEVALLRHVARLAARHLAHARRLVAAEDAALHLQRALVAEPGRPHPNLEIAGAISPPGTVPSSVVTGSRPCGSTSAAASSSSATSWATASTRPST